MEVKKNTIGLGFVKFPDSTGLMCSINEIYACSDHVFIGRTNLHVDDCMKLNRDQVAELIPILQTFVRTGKLAVDPSENVTHQPTSIGTVEFVTYGAGGSGDAVGGLHSSSSVPAIDYRRVCECLAEHGSYIVMDNGKHIVGGSGLKGFRFSSLDHACEAAMAYYNAIELAKRLAAKVE